MQARRAKAEATAVVMQSAYRGYVGRQRAKVCHHPGFFYLLLGCINHIFHFCFLQVMIQERLVTASIAIQAAARGMIARNVASSLREQRTRDKSAIRIQAVLRGLFGKRHVQAMRLDRQESIRVWPVIYLVCVCACCAQGDVRVA